MYADGPSTFVSGHGIDAFSAGVQTFRAYHCLVAISGNVDRPGGNLRLRTPAGFKHYIDLLHMPEFRLDAETEQRTIGADRFPLWAGPKGWQTACHNPSVIEAMLTGKPLSRARALCQRRQHPRHLSRHAAHHGGAALARLRGGGGARHDADGRVRRHRAAQDHDAGGGGGLLHALRPDGALHARRRAAAGRGALARSTSPCRCSTRWASARPSTRHLLPWRSQREFNTYLLGDSGIRIEDLERTGYRQVSAEPMRRTARSPRRPARSSCSPRPWRSLGLDPLPAYEPPSRERAAAAECAASYPLILVTGDREKSYHHSRFRDQPWAMKVSPDPRLTMHPDTARALGLDDGAWVQARGRARQGRLPPAPQAHRRDAARRRQHRHGLVAAVGARARARRARRQHQRRACPTTAPGTRSPAPPTSAASGVASKPSRDVIPAPRVRDGALAGIGRDPCGYQEGVLAGLRRDEAVTPLCPAVTDPPVAVRPPSTTYCAPVMLLARSEHKNSTTLATSSAVP